jgi:hypothetical protein
MRADRKDAIRGLAVEAALAQVVGALERGGVEPLLLKGPALARWLYDDPSERGFEDVDLLVAPDRFDRAERVLEAAGFAEGPTVGGRDGRRHAVHWTRDAPVRLAVDLHRAPFMLAERDHAAVWRALTAAAGTLELGGRAISVPSTPAHALIVVLHAVQHGFAAPRAGEDLRRAVERVDERDWRAAASLARSLDAETPFAAGLRMHPAGADVADRLGLPAPTSARLRLHLHPAPSPWTGFDRLAKLASVRERARALAGIAFPSGAYLRLADPLARRGRLGLGLAFLRRALRLVVRAPAGYLAWRAVAREERDAPPSGLGATIDAVRRTWWAARALRACRTQLPDAGIDGVRLPPPPACRTDGDRGLGRALRIGRARCLERALIRQRWLGSRGEERDLVLGVTAPGPAFRAHAWLAGDPEDTSAFGELHRRPASTG